MDDKLLDYYERELTYIRKLGAEFAGKYPKIAGRLLLEPGKCEDPHTERLIEAFAFISGRIHKKIDDDFPEITESLLNIIYPHYVRPIPSMTVAKFEPSRDAISAAGHRLDKGVALYSKPVGGTPCQFATVYPVSLLPLEVASAELRDPRKTAPKAQQAIVVRLKTFNALKISDIAWRNLRFFLNGPHQHVYHLYELLMNNVCHVECEHLNRQGIAETVPLSPEDIQPVGLSPDENIMPYSKRSFPGYLLLFEYFCFPEKFLFFDLLGLDRIGKRISSDAIDIWIYLDKIPKSNLVINEATFCLHATPAVNLFKRIAEPIRVEHQKTEYQVIPDIRRRQATEIFSIDRVTASARGSLEKETEYRPFYSLGGRSDEESGFGRKAFWHTQRLPSGMKDDDGTEVFISFADIDFAPVAPDSEILTLHVTCSNRDLPSRLPFGDASGDFSMEIAAPVARINSLIKPTPTRRPSLGGALQWRLISHLSLNYLSLVNGGEEALKEILRLYNFDDSPANRQQIDGIVSLKHQYATKRVGNAFCRGVQATMEFDEDKYVGAGLYLFASVLERFLGEYVSVNSFSQLIVKTMQRKEALKIWPPRNGNRVLL